MEWLWGLDWVDVFVPSLSLLEIFLRGTAVYLALFFMLRFAAKRQVGSIGIADLLVLVLLADAAQNAMADDYGSVTDGILLVGVIIFWSYVLDWLAFRYPGLRKLMRPPRLTLVEDGRELAGSLKKANITHDELMSAVRGHGLMNLKRVHRAFLEPDGLVSVITVDQKPTEETRHKEVL